MKIAMAISGGDSVGINSFLFNLSKFFESKISIFDGGINGLVKGKMRTVSYRDIVDYSNSAMPIVASGRTDRHLTEDEYVAIVANLKKKKIDILILCGGDGSLMFLKKLSDYGVNCFGIGMTVDNDVSGSEYTIGFSTACEQIKNEVTKLRMTGRSLTNRIFMVELLGAYSGELTLQAAIKSNADIALIPEKKIDTENLIRRINYLYKKQNSVIILCSEGYTDEYYPGFQGAIFRVINEIESFLPCRVRKSILGFSLRSGDPTCEEIYQSTLMANEIIRCIHSGMKNKAIIINPSNKAIPIDLSSIHRRTAHKNETYLNMAKEMKII